MKRLMLVIGLRCLWIGSAIRKTGGTIPGEVKDQSGALVPNAAVTVTNAATNLARSTESNSAGIYSFPGLIPGTYHVKATAPGFQTAVTNDIELQVQQTARVDFALVVGQAAQRLEVMATSSFLSPAPPPTSTPIAPRRTSPL